MGDHDTNLPNPIGKKTIGTIARMSGGLVEPAPFIKSWQEMIQYNYEYLINPYQEKINYIEATVSYHSLARDGLIDEMRGEWILMLDSDISFEPDLVARMLNRLETHNLDVLLGMYPIRGELHPPVLYGYNKKTKQRYVIGDWPLDIDIQQCDGGGAGCLMIRKSVVEKIKETGESLFSIREPWSEDNSFFLRCRELGIKVYFSPNIQVKHLIYKELDLDKDYPKDKRASLSKRENDVEGFN